MEQEDMSYIALQTDYSSRDVVTSEQRSHSGSFTHED